MKFFKPKKTITRGGVPLLIRWNIFECKAFSVKIHKLISPDHSCMHDHPWAFITFLMWGSYVEHTPKGSRIYGRWSLLYRHAKYTHRLEIHQPVWTFVITFRKCRVWGFKTPRGWINWKRFDDTNTCE